MLVLQVPIRTENQYVSNRRTSVSLSIPEYMNAQLIIKPFETDKEEKVLFIEQIARDIIIGKAIILIN